MSLGISIFTHPDELLTLSKEAQLVVKSRLRSYTVCPKSGCHNWTKETFPSGRARLSIGKKAHIAARLVWVLSNGTLGDLFVLHSCDNPLCVNVEHLHLGTAAQNSKEMVDRGRSARGVRNRGAVLTEKDVVEIRQLIASGGVQSTIAKRYGVSKNCIWRIAKRRTWRHI